MECASRGMSFSQYQTTQEIMYQDYMAKSLTEKYATLSSQMDNVINDANGEITSLRDKLSGLHIEKKNLETKNQDLANAFREKSRAQQRLQVLYQKLKSQQNAHHIEHAAADDAESVIHSINGAQFVNDVYGVPPQRPFMAHVRGQDLPPIYSHARAGSSGSSGNERQRSRFQQDARGGISFSQNWTGGGMPLPRMNPPQPAMYAGRLSSNLMQAEGFAGIGRNERQATPNRQPLGALERNMSSGQRMNGYGPAGSAEVGRGMAEQYLRPPQGRVGTRAA